MIHWLLGLLFKKIKKPIYREISREEREFITRHYPKADLD